MKFTVAAVLAAAAGASANYAGNVTYTTEVVDVYTTYCPGPTQITHGSKTWTVTEATTLTITDCPCTVTKPVTVSTAVVCNTCTGVFTNTTMATAPGTQAPPPATASATGVAPSATPSTVTGGAGKAAALSGAGLAGVVGLAAFIL